MAVRSERAGHGHCFSRLTIDDQGCFLPCLRRFFPVASSAHVLRVNYNSKKGLLPFTRQRYSMANVSLTRAHVLRTHRFFTRSNYTTRFGTIGIFSVAPRGRGCSIVLVRSMVRRVNSGGSVLRRVQRFLTPNKIMFVNFPT